jgi:membrane fusion protein, multidrug efflux system
MNTKKILILIGLIGAVAAGVAYRLKPAPEEAKKGPSEQAVGIALAKTQDVPVMVDVNGAVVSLKTVDVRAQATNLLAKVHIKEGQFVQAGTPLFSLDDRTDIANVAKANATLARDRTLGADLDRQFQRSQELKAKNFIAQSALDTTTAQRDAQVALIQSDEAALAAAQVALGYNTIRAPISGRTGLINVFPGSLILPNTTSMVTVTQMDPIAVQFTIPESSLKDLQLTLKAQQDKSNVRVKIPSTGDEQKGHLYFVDNAVDASTGTIKAKAQFANKDNLLWPGQFLQVRVELATLKDAVTIPSAAVITGLTGKFVYVAAEDNTVSNKPITVRHTFGDSMAVSGINAGDRVVTDGKQNLRPGGKIRVISPQAPKAAGGPGEKAGDKAADKDKPADAKPAEKTANASAKPTEASKP